MVKPQPRIVTVVVPDRMVVVDGEAHRCEFDAPEGLLAVQAQQHSCGRAIRREWTGRPPETTVIEGPGNFFAEIQPYLDAWETAKAAAEAEAQERQAEDDRQRQAAEDQHRQHDELMRARRAEYDAAEKRIEAEAPLREAERVLYETDHEVIKAAERVALGQPAGLDPTLVERRRKARERIIRFRAENSRPVN